MKSIYEIAKQHQIVEFALSHVINHNKSNTAPYHNFYHLCCVAEAAHEMATLYSPEHAVSLTIAGLFHDFDHSAGLYPDHVNIKMALEGFNLWRSGYDGHDNELCNDAVVVKCIQMTQFPYTVPNSQIENDMVSKIIRDADMVQCLLHNWPQQILFGLGAEFKKDLFDTIDGQINFLLNLEINTEWLKTQWLAKKLEIVEALKMLQEFRHG